MKKPFYCVGIAKLMSNLSASSFASYAKTLFVMLCLQFVCIGVSAMSITKVSDDVFRVSNIGVPEKNYQSYFLAVITEEQYNQTRDPNRWSYKMYYGLSGRPETIDINCSQWESGVYYVAKYNGKELLDVIMFEYVKKETSSGNYEPSKISSFTYNSSKNEVLAKCIISSMDKSAYVIFSFSPDEKYDCTPDQSVFYFNGLDLAAGSYTCTLYSNNKVIDKRTITVYRTSLDVSNNDVFCQLTAKYGLDSSTKSACIKVCRFGEYYAKGWNSSIIASKNVTSSIGNVVFDTDFWQADRYVIGLFENGICTKSSTIDIRPQSSPKLLVTNDYINKKVKITYKAVPDLHYYNKIVILKNDGSQKSSISVNKAGELEIDYSNWETGTYTVKFVTGDDRVNFGQNYISVCKITDIEYTKYTNSIYVFYEPGYGTKVQLRAVHTNPLYGDTGYIDINTNINPNSYRIVLDNIIKKKFYNGIYAIQMYINGTKVDEKKISVTLAN